ncbi:unnamed protein product, partial [Ectocarpus fasciculatus]
PAAGTSIFTAHQNSVISCTSVDNARSSCDPQVRSRSRDSRDRRDDAGPVRHCCRFGA